MKIALVVVGFFLCLPIIIPYVCIMSAVDRRRLRKLADNTTCGQCGSNLGAASLALADADDLRQRKELLAKHPGIRLRVQRQVVAVCPHCDARYAYDQATHLLVEFQVKAI